MVSEQYCYNYQYMLLRSLQVLECHIPHLMLLHHPHRKSSDIMTCNQIQAFHYYHLNHILQVEIQDSYHMCLFSHLSRQGDWYIDIDANHP
jgi:hypothetical protein